MVGRFRGTYMSPMMCVSDRNISRVLHLLSGWKLCRPLKNT